MKKQKKLLIILAAVFAVLLIGYFAVVRPLTKDEGEGTTTPAELLEGEAYYNFNGSYRDQIPVLFPQFNRGDVFQVRVTNGDGSYLFYHYISDASPDAYNYFLLGQYDDEDKPTFYRPEISTRYQDFSYSSLYDETSKIPTMLSATGSVFFKDRVYIRADEESPISDEAYQKILHKYGLAESDSPAYFEIVGYAVDRAGNYIYNDAASNRLVSVRITEDKKTKYYYSDTVEYTDGVGYTYDRAVEYTGPASALSPIGDTDRVQRVYVGNATADDTGYYILLAGREIVYTTGTTSVGDVAFKGLAYYVKPRVIATADSSYTPYMPASFRIWKKDQRVASTPISENDSVFYSFATRNDDGEITGAGGGAFTLVTGSTDERIRRILLNAGLSEGDILTLTTMQEFPLQIPLSAGETVNYRFYAVTAIIGDTSVNQTAGSAVGENDIVLVQYRTYRDRDDTKIGEGTGIIDLSDPDTPSEIRAALTGKTVSGASDWATPIATADVVYDTSVVTVYSCEYNITGILGIATREDFSDGITEVGTAVPASGYAMIAYTVTISGVRYDEKAVINMSEESDPLRNLIRTALIGQTVGKKTALKVPVSFAYDPIRSYTIWNDLKIESIKSYAEELSFSFVNESERDIFYAFSMYEVKGPENRTMYTLDHQSCQNVLVNFEKVEGSETVCVGLTADAIQKYGLDAFIFYYEMPFGLYDNSKAGSDKVDYGWNYTVGFYLYISAAAEDGSRYIGSTLYDIVVKMDAGTFDFLDWDFRKDWVRNNLVMIDIINIAEVSFTANYSDYQESHSFAVTCNREYYHPVTSNTATERLYVQYVPGSTVPWEESLVEASRVGTDNRKYQEGQIYTKAGILVRPMNTEYYRVEAVTSGTNLDALYERINGTISRVGVDFEGVANFKSLMSLFYNTYYSQATALSESELATLTGNPSHCVFSLRIRLVAEEEHPNGREFRISFYPYAGGFSLVEFHDMTTGQISREFTVATSEVRNMLTAVRTVVAGGTIDNSNACLPDPN